MSKKQCRQQVLRALLCAAKSRNNYHFEWEQMWLRKAAAWMVMWSEAAN